MEIERDITQMYTKPVPEEKETCSLVCVQARQGFGARCLRREGDVCRRMFAASEEGAVVCRSWTLEVDKVGSGSMEGSSRVDNGIRIKWGRNIANEGQTSLEVSDP